MPKQELYHRIDEQHTQHRRTGRRLRPVPKDRSKGKKARRRDSIVLKRTLEASRLEYHQTQYQTDQANTHASYASTEEEEQALLEEARVLARIEERVRAARERARRRVHRCGAAQSPVNTEVSQEEPNSAEEQVLENSIISAKEEDASRLQRDRARERLENLHLEK